MAAWVRLRAVECARQAVQRLGREIGQHDVEVRALAGRQQGEPSGPDTSDGGEAYLSIAVQLISVPAQFVDSMVESQEHGDAEEAKGVSISFGGAGDARHVRAHWRRHG